MYLHPKYPNIFTPIQIGNMVLRNRIILGPINSYTDKATAGYGMMIRGTSGNVDFPHFRMKPGKYMFEESELERVKQELLVIQRNGTKCEMEITYCGIFADYDFVYGPSEGINPFGKPIKELTVEQIHQLVQKFADAAKEAKKMGYDMVMIHFAHGWIATQFLSEVYNHRTDEYGGSLENRMRFGLEVCEAIRNAVGPDYPLDMRISWYENYEGCPTPEEVIEFLKKAEKYINMVNVSANHIMNPHMSEVPHAYCEHCVNVEAAYNIKKNLHIPVAVVGAIMTPEEAEEILASKKADMVVIGRAATADPYWITKALECRSDDIVPCIRCEEGCYRCSVNLRDDGDDPSLAPNPLPLALEKKKIVIVGGGPAGMKAAITARERGHEVVLFEKNKELGGLLLCADQDEHKIDLKRYKNYLIHQVEKHNVKVVLNKAPTIQELKDEKPDVLLLAFGSSPVTPNIPGVDKKIVQQSVDAWLENLENVGDEVVVIGGGLNGCELAYTLCTRGKKVHLIEATDKLANRTRNPYENTMRGRIVLLIDKEKNIDIHTSTKVKEILDDGVIIEKDNKEIKLEANTVLLSVGMKPNNENLINYYGITPWTTTIGDLNRVANIRKTTEDGFFAVSTL